MCCTGFVIYLKKLTFIFTETRILRPGFCVVLAKGQHIFWMKIRSDILKNWWVSVWEY